MVDTEIEKNATMKKRDLYNLCYITYVNYFINNGAALNRSPIFQDLLDQLNLPGNIQPDLLNFLVNFGNAKKKINKNMAALLQSLNYTEDQKQSYITGRVIWFLFKDGQRYIRNVCNPLWVKAKVDQRSGINRFNEATMDIRCSLDIDLQRRTEESKLRRSASKENDLFKGRSSTAIALKRDWIFQQMTFWTPKNFNTSNFPKHWIVFNLLSYPNKKDYFSSYKPHCTPMKRGVEANLKDIAASTAGNNKKSRREARALLSPSSSVSSSVSTSNANSIDAAVKPLVVTHMITSDERFLQQLELQNANNAKLADAKTADVLCTINHQKITTLLNSLEFFKGNPTRFAAEIAEATKQVEEYYINYLLKN
jgi:hypothetical protein